MKYIEEYNSIRDFKADLNSPECICAAQVPTPVGDAMGYQQNGEFVFSVSGTVISEDSLRTIDLSSFSKNEISSGDVQTFINTCNEGDTMIFNPTVGLLYMDTLNIDDKARWDGFNLILGVKEDDLFPYIKVWLDDGRVVTINNNDEWDEFDEIDSVVKMTIGEEYYPVGPTIPHADKMRYMVYSKKQNHLGNFMFDERLATNLHTLTVNRTTPPTLVQDFRDSLNSPSCQRIYIPKGSKKGYVKGTNWDVLANKIFEV